jgi:hypothetical protein
MNILKIKFNIIFIIFIIFFATITQANEDKQNKKKTETKLTKELSCNKKLICNITTDFVGLSCDNKKIEYLVNKETLSFYSPYVSKYSILFTRFNPNYTIDEITWGYREDLVPHGTTLEQFLLDRKSLILYLTWEPASEKNENIPHTRFEVDNTMRDSLMDTKTKSYVRIYKKPLKHSSCKLIQPEEVLNVYKEKIFKAQKDNKF